MRTISFNNWNTGIVNDPRDPREGAARMVSNFDIITNPYKMTPYHDGVDGDSGSSTSHKANFCIGYSGSNYMLYALGVKSGAATAEVLAKSLTTGGSTDLDDNGWSSPSNNQSSSGSTNFNLFVYYATTGLIYGARAGTAIWAFSPTGTGWADTSHSLSYTNIAQGLVHSKDDILYIPYDNKIAKNNNGSWTDAAITIPSKYVINSICEYGNYLAIGAAPLSGSGNSVVYLWDRDSSLTTLSESYDWGEGTLKVLEQINGTLVGISLYGGSSITLNDRVIFKYLGTGGAEKFLEMTGTTSTQLPIAKQRHNNRIYFMMKITVNGSVREGVWSIGRTGETTPLTVVHERTTDNDTSTGSGTLLGFYMVGDYLFQAFTDNSGTYTVTKTNDQSSYTATSIFESTINPELPELVRGSAGNRSSNKSLIAIALSYEPLPSSAQAVLKYRVDGGSWTTIFTETTDGQVTTERFVDASGSPFTSGREYEFRIESTGGAEITELKYKYEVLETLL